MSEFLTVKEAAQLIGKSPSSIRRIIYPIIEDDHHPDRSQIQPSIEEVQQLRLKGENFAWKVSEELLRREAPAAEPASKPSSSSHAATTASSSDALVDMLRRELDIKNHQITQQGELIGRQMELISGLSERLREGNVLIGSLQQHLSLAEPKSRSSEVVEVAHSSGESAPQSEPTPTKDRNWLFSIFDW